MAVDGVDPANLERFDVTVRVVELLLSSSGEGVETLEMYVSRLASAFGLDIELLVLPEQVLLTEKASGTSTPLAIVRRTPGLSRLDQVMDLKVLVSDIEHGLPLAEASRRVKAIADAPPSWQPWLRVIGVVLFTAGFAPSVLATGGEVVATVLLGAVMGVLLVTFEGRPFEPLVPFIGAFLLTILATTLLSGLASATGVVLVVVPALFIVVPGDYLSAAAGELIVGRVAAGATRLVYAAFVLSLLVVGVAGGAEITGRADLLEEHPVTPTLPFAVVVLAWIPFSVGLTLAFNAHLSALRWLIPTVVGTYLVQQGATELVGDISGTLAAGIALGAVANIASRPARRPPRLVIVLGGFFVLTVGGLGLRGATALIGNDVVSGFGDLRDFFIQLPTVAIAISIGMLVTKRWSTTTPYPARGAST